jgi:hypothetical protein
LKIGKGIFRLLLPETRMWKNPSMIVDFNQWLTTDTEREEDPYICLKASIGYGKAKVETLDKEPFRLLISEQ